MSRMSPVGQLIRNSSRAPAQFVGVALMLVALALPARADESAWTLRSSTNNPAARQDASLILDAGNSRLILFGGRSSNSDGSSPVTYNDVWSYSLATHQWTAQSPAGSAPPAAAGHTAIYDPGRTGVSPRMLVFGGQGASTTVYALSLTGTMTWSTVTTTGTPPSGWEYHWAVYDSGRDQMVTGGGLADSRIFALKLNQATPQWVQLLYTGDPTTHHAGAAYDPSTQKVVIIGGLGYISGICPTPTTVAVHNLRVLDLAPATPTYTDLGAMPYTYPGSIDMTLVYDSIRSRILVFGGAGFDAGCTCGGSFPWRFKDDEYPTNATLAYKVSTNTWTTLAPTGTPPAARAHQAAAYYAPTDEMIVFGGGDHTKAINCLSGTQTYTWNHRGDTWQFDPDTVAPAAVSDLSLTIHCTSMDVSWTAPHDDAANEPTAYYELRQSSSTITQNNWWQAQIVASGAGPAPGTAMSYSATGLGMGQRLYFVVLTQDEGHNWSALSNLPYGQTPNTPYCEDLLTFGGPDAPGAPTAFAMAPPRPTPARDHTQLVFAIPPAMVGQDVDLSVFDVVGRRLRTLTRGVAVAGTHTTDWDLRDDSARRVPDGVYFVRLVSQGRQLLRVVVVSH